jgi:ATP-dependent Clp protease ATP-binding subunit ClpC
LGFQISITTAAKDYIAEKGWDSQFGARPLKRAIQKYVEDTLAEEIIKTKLTEHDLITVDYIPERDEVIVQVVNPGNNETN